MMLDPIIVETTVGAPPTVAFDAFVKRINDWWPMDPFSMSQGALTLDPVVGGLIVETSSDGEKFVWGHVTALEKPDHIELAWYVGSTVDTATKISVTFVPVESGRTMVQLVQSGWEALGDKAAQIRTQNDGGWRQILGACFADFVTNHSKESPGV